MSIERTREAGRCVGAYEAYKERPHKMKPDVKDSRNPRHTQAHIPPGPDQFVHIVQTDVDGTGINGKPCKGIIVRGAKICNANGPYVDELIVNSTKFMSQDDAEYAVAFALSADWSGIKLMGCPALHHKRRHLEAPFAKVSSVESLTIFDNMFVPEDHVFMNGLKNEGVICYTGYLALMFARYHRHTYISCKAAVSEVFASQAALVADVNDIAKESHVREKLCDIIQIARPPPMKIAKYLIGLPGYEECPVTRMRARHPVRC